MLVGKGYTWEAMQRYDILYKMLDIYSGWALIGKLYNVKSLSNEIRVDINTVALNIQASFDNEHRYLYNLEHARCMIGLSTRYTRKGTL